MNKFHVHFKLLLADLANSLHLLQIERIFTYRLLQFEHEGEKEDKQYCGGLGHGVPSTIKKQTPTLQQFK